MSGLNVQHYFANKVRLIVLNCPHQVNLHIVYKISVFDFLYAADHHVTTARSTLKPSEFQPKEAGRQNTPEKPEINSPIIRSSTHMISMSENSFPPITLRRFIKTLVDQNPPSS